MSAILVTVSTAGFAAGAANTGPPPKDPPAEAERSESGLTTLRLAPGQGSERPDGNDVVTFHYEIWTPAGEKVRSSRDAGEPGTYQMEKLIPAWREALQLMVAGEKRRLWVPAELAVANPKSGPAGATICDIELLEVRRVTDISAGELTPPADAERTRFGAYAQVLEEGTGSETAAAGVGALVNYVMWTQDGKVYDTTVFRNRPTFFLYDRVMPAFADALKAMVVGEKRRIWIPGNVANGQWMGSPKGMLVFDVELLRVMDENVLAAPQGGEGGHQG